MVIQTNDNKYASSQWIVDASAGKGTHTTIQTAINSAQVRDVIIVHPGVYTENLTLKAGVSIIGLAENFTAASADSTVRINGSITASYTGQASIEKMQIAPATGNSIILTGANDTILQIENCDIRSTAGSLISVSSTGTSASLEINNCNLIVTNTTAAPLAVSFASTSRILSYRSIFRAQSGVAPAMSTLSGGGIDLYYSEFDLPITTSGTSRFSLSFGYAAYSTATQFTLNGTGLTGGNNFFFMSQVSGGASNPMITVGTGASVSLRQVDLLSQANPLISGAGTTTYDLVTTGAGIGTISSTTATPRALRVGRISFDGGTTYLDNYSTASWTPTLAFGGASAGIVYSFQIGRYQRVGNVVNFYFTLGLSNVGTSTGVASIGGLPATLNSAIQTNHVFDNWRNLNPGAGNVPYAQRVANDTSFLLFASRNNQGALQLSNTNFTSTSIVALTGQIFLS